MLCVIIISFVMLRVVIKMPLCLVSLLCHFSENYCVSGCAQSHTPTVVMLIVIILSVIIMNVVLHIVIVLNVVVLNIGFYIKQSVIMLNVIAASVTILNAISRSKRHKC
jgi:hypothetical protein